MSINQQLTPETKILKNELSVCCFIKNFDIKFIQTFGAFRATQLQALTQLHIKQQTFKQFMFKVLKICTLVDPIICAVQQIDQVSVQSNAKSKISNPNNLLSIFTIIKVLHQNLFYRHIVKLKMQNSETVIHLVNNRFTQMNRKVIIAGLIAFMSKKLTFEEISTALLMFNLQQALLKLKPFGLPLQQSGLQKYLRKLDRVVNSNSLRNFINSCKIKQLQLQPQFQTNEQQILCNTQYVIGPQQFLYLIAMSEKKASASQLLFNKFNHNIGSTKQGINIFIQRKKAQHSNSNLNNSSKQNLQINNSIQQQNNQNALDIFKQQNEKTNNLGQSKLGIRGLSLYSSENKHLKRINQLKEVFTDIKKYLNENKHQKIIIDKKSRKEQNGTQASTTNLHRRTKSVALKNQMNKLERPQSALFKKSINILNKNKQNLQTFEESFQKMNDHIKNQHKTALKRCKSHYIKRQIQQTFNQQFKKILRFQNKKRTLTNYTLNTQPNEANKKEKHKNLQFTKGYEFSRKQNYSESKDCEQQSYLKLGESNFLKTSQKPHNFATSNSHKNIRNTQLIEKFSKISNQTGIGFKKTHKRNKNIKFEQIYHNKKLKISKNNVNSKQVTKQQNVKGKKLQQSLVWNQFDMYF